jgi:hypothetical protein
MEAGFVKIFGGFSKQLNGVVNVFQSTVDFSIVTAPFEMSVAERFDLLAKVPFESLGLLTTASPGVFFNLPPNFDDVSFEFFVFYRIALAMLPFVVISFPFTIRPLSFISLAVPVTPLFIACPFLVAFSVTISFTVLFEFSTSVISFLTPPIAITCTFSRAFPFAVFRFGLDELCLYSGFLCFRSFRIRCFLSDCGQQGAAS